MIHLKRKALPLLLPLLALVLSTLPPMMASPSHPAPVATTAAATRPTPPRPRHSELPPPDFVPAPLRAAEAAARDTHRRYLTRGVPPATLPAGVLAGTGTVRRPSGPERLSPPALSAAPAPTTPVAPVQPRTLPGRVLGPLGQPDEAAIAEANQAVRRAEAAWRPVPVTAAMQAADVAQAAQVAQVASPQAAGPMGVRMANMPVGLSVTHPLTEPQIGAVVASVYPVTPTGNYVFSATPLSTSVIAAERFPTLIFNPVTGTKGLPSCTSYVTGGPTQSPALPVSSSTWPFANVAPQDDSSCRVQYLQSGDVYNPNSPLGPPAGVAYQAGVTGTMPMTPLAEFQAVFTATLTVVAPGYVTLGGIVDDNAVVYVGAPRKGSAALQPQSVYSPTTPATITIPARGPFTHAPLAAAFFPGINPPASGSGGALTTTLNFLAPGSYPIEVDYNEVQPRSSLELVLTADTGTASRLTGDRDCGSCDASVTAADTASALNAQLAVHKPFNSRTGNLFRTDTDLTDPTPGRPLIWARTYNSQAVGDPATPPVGLGPGWQDPYATHLITTSSVITVVSPEGNLLQFLDQGDGTFRPFPGVDATLVQNADGSYTEGTWAQESVTFNAAGMPTTMTDAHGRSLQLLYDGQGRLQTVQDASNPARALTITYATDGSNHIVTVGDEVGQTVQYSYDGNGNLSGVVNALGRPASPLTYAYQDATRGHLLTGVTNALGQSVEQTSFDGATPPRVSSQTEQDGTTVSATYGATATTLTTTGAGQTNPTPDGGPMVETITYDPNTDAMTGVSIDGVPMESTQFDANFDPAVVADGDGNSHAAVVTYNRLGLPLSIADPVSGTTIISYDASLNPITVTDGLGRLTVNQYDATNDLIAQTAGMTTGSAGVPASAGVTTTYGYNGAAQPTDTTAPDGTVTHDAYNAQGEVITQTVGSTLPAAQQRVTTYGYDTLGRRTDTTTGYGLPVPRTDHTVYNDDGTIAQTVQNYVPAGQPCPLAPCNVSTSYGYDALGRQVWTRDALGRYNVTHDNAAQPGAGHARRRRPAAPAGDAAGLHARRCGPERGHALRLRRAGAADAGDTNGHPDRDVQRGHAAVQRRDDARDADRVRPDGAADDHHAEPGGQRRLRPGAPRPERADGDAV